MIETGIKLFFQSIIVFLQKGSIDLLLIAARFPRPFSHLSQSPKIFRFNNRINIALLPVRFSQLVSSRKHRKAIFF